MVASGLVGLVLLTGTALSPAAAPPEAAQTTRLTLPFDGIWGVIQGFDSGDTHVGYAAFALDFVPAQRKTDKPPLAGAPLSAFACYGRPVLAPADGRVVRAVRTARDWPAYAQGLGEGNYVIIQHAEHEFSELRHLMANSVTVSAGQQVRRGQQLGRCGNSGNAKTPHLHFAFLSGVAPIQTRRFVVSQYEVLAPDGVFAAGDGKPRQGQLLRRVADKPLAEPNRR